MGSARAPRVRCSAPSRNTGGVQKAHHVVTALSLTLTGEGAGQHTRGRVCSPKGTASLRLKGAPAGTLASNIGTRATRDVMVRPRCALSLRLHSGALT